MQVNSVGVMWLVDSILPGMIERKYGKIVNISSVGGGINVFPQFNIADGMSKAAIAFMTKALAGRLIYEPVEVFCVCPGATETSML